MYTAYTEYKNISAPATKNLILIGILVIVSLYMLFNVVEHSQRSWDYKQYETAFQSVKVDDNPYQSTRYLYPPFFAGSMVTVYRSGTVLLPLIGIDSGASSLWMFVFYIHQSALLFALLFAYYLSLRFADVTGLKPLKGMLFVSGFFLFNVPLLRAVIYN